MNAVTFVTIFLAAFVAVTVAAPSYGGPSYGGPSYGAPAPVYGHQVYSYPSPAPPVRCGSNLLVGCAPSVAHVGCGSYSPPSYPSYGPSYGAPAPYKAY
ncbi:vitelline membrane protein 15a-1 [Bradysia coprophila]|uniref:vitelline membrane protein 15a-1 n=1 Tax=Bradysia coprophila TaxID=38358 RepID=UPI00187DAE25|nr:vitelline membrane protein 15a-1 [Bradysia coprophila]